MVLLGSFFFTRSGENKILGLRFTSRHKRSMSLPDKKRVDGDNPDNHLGTSEKMKLVVLDIEYHHNMLMSHQKVNPKDIIVGWYSTGHGVTGGSALIHEFYSREVPNPIHLTIDT